MFRSSQQRQQQQQQYSTGIAAGHATAATAGAEPRTPVTAPVNIKCIWTAAHSQSMLSRANIHFSAPQQCVAMQCSFASAHTSNSRCCCTNSTPLPLSFNIKHCLPPAHRIFLPGQDCTAASHVAVLVPCLQSVLTIDKRVMICAADGSSNEHVTLDHRANHPAFCINR